MAHTIYERVIEKLRREPVEDFRIDYEDGYGNRPDAEEDGHAAAAAAEVAEGMLNADGAAAGTAIPPRGAGLRPRAGSFTIPGRIASSASRNAGKVEAGRPALS